MIGEFSIPSGLQFSGAFDLLTRFCQEEYAYYDAIRLTDPNQIEPLDVLVTVAVNSYVNSAARVRDVHRGMADACNSLLAEIPEDADLLTFDPGLEVVERLLHAACQVRGVLLPVATKVLHRKRRALIPMLDNAVLKHYLAPAEFVRLRGITQDGGRAASVGRVILDPFRSDLSSAKGVLNRLSDALARDGYELTPLRILKILIWTEVEPLGYYRQ